MDRGTEAGFQGGKTAPLESSRDRGTDYPQVPMHCPVTLDSTNETPKVAKVLPTSQSMHCHASAKFTLSAHRRKKIRSP
jgi:hypothetical protein